jgi:hypothetical protein
MGRIGKHFSGSESDTVTVKRAWLDSIIFSGTGFDIVVSRRPGQDITIKEARVG